MYQGGYNQNYTTQQPYRNQHAKQVIFDTTWAEKPSQTGEFKYGLFGCCHDVTSAIQGILACFCPFPFCILVAVNNGIIANVVGK